jgi:citrate synthase
MTSCRGDASARNNGARGVVDNARDRRGRAALGEGHRVGRGPQPREQHDRQEPMHN